MPPENARRDALWTARMSPARSRTTGPGRVNPLAAGAGGPGSRPIRLAPDEEDVREADRDRPRRASIGDYDAEVLVGEGPQGRPHPLAVLATPWIDEHLLLYARTRWRRNRNRKNR